MFQNISPFYLATSGIHLNCPIIKNSKEIDYFLLYFDEEHFTVIVDETNRYHEHKFGECDLSENAKTNWKHKCFGNMYISRIIYDYAPYV